MMVMVSPNTRHHKRARFRKRRTGIITAWKRSWRSAGFKQRAIMLHKLLIVSVCVIAVITAASYFVTRNIAIHHAQANQEQTAIQYDFNPGNIISDGQFFNANAMSRDQIAAFIEKHNAHCTGDNCLASMRFDTDDIAADEYCSAYAGGGGQTAADIIYDSAQACGISPQVLLTIMQKEQHLLTATDPTDFQYKAAMGLSCPDDANCDPSYAGFFKQVFGTAQRFRYYMQHEDDYAYHAGQLNYIQYNPVASCGGSNVYIENQATALLYIYTPYQPNQAALQAGAGTGDACSSYGNRNFALIYNNWFGNPRR